MAKKKEITESTSAGQVQQPVYLELKALTDVRMAFGIETLMIRLLFVV